jgi:hypothetical protein
MDGYLKENLDIYKDLPGKDWDVVGAVDGTEGGGKSVIAQQIAYYFDPTFCMERMVFRHADFKKTVLAATKGQAVVWDEAMSGLNSKTSMQIVNVTLCDLLAEIRQRNLFIIVVLPTFFDLVKYVALWRARFLIHIYHDKFERGFFRFYNDASKRHLYVLGKKTYDYGVGKANFFGRFPNVYTVNEEAYREKKMLSLRATDETLTSESVKRYRNHLEVLMHFTKGLGYKTKDMLELFEQRCYKPLDLRSLQRLLKEKATSDNDDVMHIDLQKGNRGAAVLGREVIDDIHSQALAEDP